MKKIFMILCLLCFIIQGVSAEDSNDFQSSEEKNEEIEKTKYVGLGVKYTDYIYRPYVIEVIPGSPAEKSGFQEGDLVIEVNGQKIFTNDGSFINGEEGDDFSIVVLRETKRFILTGELGEFSTEGSYGSHNSGTEETRTRRLKESTYLNEYDIVNYNENYKYVLFISKYDESNSYTESLDDTGNIGEGIIKKEINSSIFTVDAKDLSSIYEGEKITFRTELFLEIDGEYYYGSESENYGYFDLTVESKRKEVMRAIGKYYSTEAIEDGKIDKILLQYKEKIGDEIFEEKLRQLLDIVDDKIESIIDKIKSEDDIIKYSEVLSRLHTVGIIIDARIILDTIDDLFDDK